GLFLPADQYSAEAVEPGLGSLIDPATSLGVRMATMVFDFLPPRFDMRHEVPTAQSLAELCRIVGFVGAHMLPAASARLRPRHGDAVQGWPSERDVMSIRSRNHQPKDHTAGIGQHRSFNAQLAAIRWVFPGFFPRRAEPCSS